MATPSLTMRGIIFTVGRTFPSVRGINGSILRENKDKSKILYLDARPSNEYKISHIPGSLRIDHESSKPWINIEFNNIDKVVCYCSVGYRSSILASKLQAHLKGAPPVYNLEGGLFQWAIEGGEMKGDIPQKVHHFSSIWGKLLPEHMRYAEPTSSSNL